MFPVEMTLYPQWVCWGAERNEDGTPSKIPYNPVTGKRASSTDPSSWNTYETVIAAMASGFYAGIGFVLTDNDPYTIIDLDDPYKPENPPMPIEKHHEMAVRHGKIIGMMNSYTEWSPSGKGMHIIVRGRVPENRSHAKIEVRSANHYLTMTGAVYHNAPIEDRNRMVNELWVDLGRGKQKAQDIVIRESEATKTDLEIYNIAMEAENGERFNHLWQGRFADAGYPSQSQGDFALVNMLGFYSRNVEQIERMFLSSGLGYRLVSGQKKKAKNYLTNRNCPDKAPGMIEKSFDNQEPDIDLTALMAKAELSFRKDRTTVTQPAVPALEWDMPPGLLGEITEFIYAAAPLPVKEVALGGALALMAGIVGRYYNVSNEGLNLYLLVLALTGTGKEAAARNIGALMAAVVKLVPSATEFEGPSEIASGPALTKFLGNKSPSCFSILGEFGLRLHQMCSENAQPNMVGIRRVLLDLFHKSGKNSKLLPHVYSDKVQNTDVLYSPSYTILGESTPETFYRHLDESMISDGLLPRFTCIEYTGDRVELNRNATNVKPSEGLVQRLADLANACLGMAANKRVIDVLFTPDAEKMYWELSTKYTKIINDNRDHEITRQLYNRAHIKVMKIAALIAVGVNPIYPVITVENIQWAVNLIERDVANILNKFQTGKVGRETGEANQAADVARCIKEYVHKPYGPTLAKALVDPAMHKCHVIPYSYVNRQCIARSSFRADKVGATFAIKRALESLVQEGLIREVKPHLLNEQFGKSMKAYVVTEPAAFS
jgi:hypothetical protein